METKTWHGRLGVEYLRREGNEAKTFFLLLFFLARTVCDDVTSPAFTLRFAVVGCNASK